eukprot:5648224-Ditylum_brightwellii.AAC.1
MENIAHLLFVLSNTSRGWQNAATPMPVKAFGIVEDDNCTADLFTVIEAETLELLPFVAVPADCMVERHLLTII